MSGEVVIKILSKLESYRPEYGRKLMETLLDCDARLEPQFFTTHMMKKQVYAGLDHFIGDWGQEVVLKGTGDNYYYFETHLGTEWRRTKVPKYQCHFYHQVINVRGGINPSNLYFTASWRKDVDWSLLFERLCAVSNAMAGMLHYFTPEENVNPYSDFALCSIAPIYNPKFPEIGWGMMFGDEFANAVDVAKLRSLGFLVKPVGAGYLVRVTEKLNDVEESLEYFCKMREILRNNLPKEIFKTYD